MVETVWFSYKTLMIFYSNWVIPYQDGSFQFLVSAKNFLLFEYEFSALLDVITSFALKLLAWISDTFILYSSSKFNPRLFLSKFSRVQDVIGKYSKQYYLTKLMDSRLIFVQIGGYSTLEPNWIIGSFNDSLNGLLCSVFASEARDPICCADSWNISWNPSTPFHPYLIATKQELSFFFHSARYHISNPIFFERWSDDVQWFQDRSTEVLPNSNELSV